MTSPAHAVMEACELTELRYRNNRAFAAAAIRAAVEQVLPPECCGDPPAAEIREEFLAIADELDP